MLHILDTNLSNWGRESEWRYFWHSNSQRSDSNKSDSFLEHSEASWHMRWFLWPFPKWDYLLTVLVSLYGSLPKTPTLMDFESPNKCYDLILGKVTRDIFDCFGNTLFFAETEIFIDFTFLSRVGITSQEWK